MAALVTPLLSVRAQVTMKHYNGGLSCHPQLGVSVLVLVVAEGDASGPNLNNLYVPL